MDVRPPNSSEERRETITWLSPIHTSSKRTHREKKSVIEKLLDFSFEAWRPRIAEGFYGVKDC